MNEIGIRIKNGSCWVDYSDSTFSNIERTKITQGKSGIVWQSHSDGILWISRSDNLYSVLKKLQQLGEFKDATVLDTIKRRNKDKTHTSYFIDALSKITLDTASQSDNSANPDKKSRGQIKFLDTENKVYKVLLNTNMLLELEVDNEVYDIDIVFGPSEETIIPNRFITLNVTHVEDSSETRNIIIGNNEKYVELEELVTQMRILEDVITNYEGVGISTLWDDIRIHYDQYKTTGRTLCQK